MLRTYLVYNTVVRLCHFFVVAGKFVITTGKKILVVCLAGARSLLRPEKKSSSCDFYAKLNVSNLNVTNLY